MRNRILKYFPLPSCLRRNVLGTRNLGDILSEREAIASEMQEGLDEATDPWGVLVERVEVCHVDDLGPLMMIAFVMTPIDYHYQHYQRSGEGRPSAGKPSESDGGRGRGGQERQSQGD